MARDRAWRRVLAGIDPHTVRVEADGASVDKCVHGPLGGDVPVRHPAAVSKRAAEAARVAGLAASYVIVAHAGLSFDALAGFATLVWPPTGIALAALLLLGYRYWPGILIGASVANLIAGAPVAVALAIGGGNTFEALLAVYLLRRVPRFTTTLETIPAVVGLIVLAGMVSTMVSATIGVGALYLGDLVAAAQVRETWRAWWVGDLVGALLVAPVLLVWSEVPRTRFRTHWSEKVALGAGIVVVSLLTFFNELPWIPTLMTPFHQADLLLAVLIWAAFRFGQRGVVSAILLLSVAAIGATTMGFGPFVVPGLRESLLSLQTFMAIVATTFLLLGAAMAERRAALDRARELTEVAERADRAKSDFLAVMSHELRTPLTAIAGYAELLRSGIYGPLAGSQRKAMDRIERSERDLLGLIDAVLTFVKLEKGELMVRSEEVPVTDAFDAVEPLIGPDVREKRVVVERALAGPRLAVQADRKGLEQILGNLVSNASKFTADGGVITLGAERVDGRVRIWVRDTGVGIADEDMHRVFQPFFQVESGTTRRFGGIGLGLTIARDLAHRMGGDVTIAPAEGGGTMASVILPAA